MPRVSEFYGIVIYMYFLDHDPPHFHALYGGDEALVSIVSGETLRGSLPRTAGRLVEQWRSEHVEELLANWALAREPAALGAIEPLR
jgi:hypothetical protein